MKPRNFPGRRKARQQAAQVGGSCRYLKHSVPEVADTRFRIGAKNRGPGGKGQDGAQT